MRSFLCAQKRWKQWVFEMRERMDFYHAGNILRKSAKNRENR